jgi:hypothetical protein
MNDGAYNSEGPADGKPSFMVDLKRTVTRRHATWPNSEYCGITGSGNYRPEWSTGSHLVNLGYGLLVNLVCMRLIH